MIAVRNIEHDWKRSLSTVIVLSLVGLLIFQQFGSILGRWNSLGGIEREFRADLVVKARNAPGRISRPIANALPPGVENTLLTHPDLLAIQPYSGVLEIINFSNSMEKIPPRIINIDPQSDPIMYPKSFPDDLVKLLQVEGHAIANTAFAERFELSIGDTLSYQGYELKFVAIVDALSHLESLMITSNFTASAMGTSAPQQVGPAIGSFSMGSLRTRAFLLKVKPGADPSTVAGELRGMFGKPNVEVIFPEQLVSEQSFALLFTERNNRAFLITAGFAVLISIMIAIQTMRSAVLNHADEYGALQALGVGSFDLRLIAIEMAFWLGLLSTAVAVSGAFVMRSALVAVGTNFALSIELVLVVSALLMAIAFLAGLFASSAVTRIQPEALLR